MSCAGLPILFSFPREIWEPTQTRGAHANPAQKGPDPGIELQDLLAVRQLCLKISSITNPNLKRLPPHWSCSERSLINKVSVETD